MGVVERCILAIWGEGKQLPWLLWPMCINEWSPKTMFRNALEIDCKFQTPATFLISTNWSDLSKSPSHNELVCIPRTERASSVIWTKGFSYINSDMVERITTPSFHFFYMVHNIHPLFIHASVFFYNEFYNVRKVSTILSFSVLKWLLLLCFWHKNTWFF